MLGIINKDLGVFCLIDKIKKEYPKIDIYLSRYEENTEDLISLFIEKNCHILIVSKELKEKLSTKYSNIYFLALEDVSIDNSYVFDDELVDSVSLGDINKVKSILNNTKISKDKVIVLNNSVLLFIESLIKEVFSNKIISNVDLLIEDIKEIVNNNKYNVEQESKVQEIILKG